MDSRLDDQSLLSNLNLSFLKTSIHDAAINISVLNRTTNIKGIVRLPKWQLYGEMAEFFNRESDNLYYYYFNADAILSGELSSISKYLGELNDPSNYSLYAQAFLRYLSDPYRDEQAILRSSLELKSRDSMVDIRDEWTISDRITLLMGLKAKDYSADSKSLYQGNVTSFSTNFYTNMRYMFLDGLVLNIAVNRENNSNVRYATSNLTTGINYKISPKGNLRLSYFNGESAPDLYVTHRRKVDYGYVINTEILTANDSDLTGDNVQAWNYEFGNHDIELEAFETWSLGYAYFDALKRFSFKSRIFSERHRRGVVETVNLSEVDLLGYELEISFFPTQSTQLLGSILSSDMESRFDWKKALHPDLGGSLALIHDWSNSISVGLSYIGYHNIGDSQVDLWNVNCIKGFVVSGDAEAQFGLRVGYYGGQRENKYDFALNARLDF